MQAGRLPLYGLRGLVAVPGVLHNGSLSSSGTLGWNLPRAARAASAAAVWRRPRPWSGCSGGAPFAVQLACVPSFPAPCHGRWPPVRLASPDGWHELPSGVAEPPASPSPSTFPRSLGVQYPRFDRTASLHAEKRNTCLAFEPCCSKNGPGGRQERGLHSPILRGARGGGGRGGGWKSLCGRAPRPPHSSTLRRLVSCGHREAMGRVEGADPQRCRTAPPAAPPVAAACGSRPALPPCTADCQCRCSLPHA